MAVDSLESGPVRVRTAAGEFYQDIMINHDGEFVDAVLHTPSQEEALLFIIGRLEDYDINHGNKEALGLVRCEITDALKSAEDTELRGYLRDNLWGPVLDAVKLEKESFGAFQRLRQAAHLFDRAELTLVMSMVDQISGDLGSDK